MWFRQQRSQHVKQMTALMEAYTRQGNFSGVVHVQRGKDTIFERAFGLADLGAQVPNTPAHTFRIGSVSKTFTALAIMQLVEAGTLALEDRVSTFWPSYSPGDRITIHQLLSNTSGIPDYLMQPGADRWYALPHQMAELLAHIADLPLLAEPGARLSYSNSNWAILASILETVSGMRYGEYLRHKITQPLDMDDTWDEAEFGAAAQMAQGFTFRDERLVPATLIAPSTCTGSGSLLSTTADLARLHAALVEGKLLPAARLAQMTSPVCTLDDGTGYGYGFLTGTRFGRRWHGHSGGIFGYTAFLTRYPDDGLLVVVLSNLENGSAAQIEVDLAAIHFGLPVKLPSARQFVEVKAEVLQRYPGRYLSSFMGREIPFDVVLAGGNALFVHFPLLPKARLQPLAEDRFYSRLKGGDVEFRFVRSNDNVVTEVEMDWSGTRSIAPRAT